MPSSSSCQVPDATEALKSARRQMSERAAGLIDTEDRRRILEAYKRAKATTRVFERQERLESILRGADVKTSGSQDIGVVLGEEDQSSATVTAIGSRLKAETKWWKGKGKGKAKEDMEGTLRSSTSKSIDVRSSSYQGKESEAKADAEAEAKRSAIHGPGGEQ